MTAVRLPDQFSPGAAASNAATPTCCCCCCCCAIATVTSAVLLVTAPPEDKSPELHAAGWGCVMVVVEFYVFIVVFLLLSQLIGDFAALVYAALAAGVGYGIYAWRRRDRR